MNSEDDKESPPTPAEGELTEEDLDGVSGGVVMPVDIGATKLAPLTTKIAPTAISPAAISPTALKPPLKQ